MKVVRKDKYTLTNWDRITRISLPQVSALTQNGSKISVAGSEKSPLIPRASFLIGKAPTAALCSFHWSQPWQKEFGLPGAFLCGCCPVLFLPSKPLLILLVPGHCPGGGRWGSGIILRPSGNAQAHPQDL